MLEKIAKIEKHTDSQSTDFKKCNSVPLTKAERAFLKMKEEKVNPFFLEGNYINYIY